MILGTFWAQADPAVIIRERAKQLSNQNNASQGVTSPAQPPPAQPAVAPAVQQGPTLSPSLLRFNTELTAIRVESPATADQKDKLTQDLLQAALGPKPSLASVAKLAADVAAAFADKPLPAASRTRFVRELDAVLNPAKYPQAKLDGILKDVQNLFQENGLSVMKALGIADDLKMVAQEIQKGGA